MEMQDFEPLELIPADLVPTSDVLMAGNAQPPDPPDLTFSDLFPDNHYRHFEGPLGRYAGGDPAKSHPLYVSMQGLYAAYYAFARQERDNDWQRNEVTRQGMVATGLQREIARCIAQGYDNVAGTASPADGLQAVTNHIEDRQAISLDEYSVSLDSHTRRLALLDRGDEEPIPTEIDGMPVITARDVTLAMGNVPESPEVERVQRKSYAEERIDVMRKRLARVQFEYLSAMALTQMLKAAVC